MGKGAYGASVAGPGFGTASGAGSGGSVARGAVLAGGEGLCALPVVNASAIRSGTAKAGPAVLLRKTIAVLIMGESDKSWESPIKLYHRAAAVRPSWNLAERGGLMTQVKLAGSTAEIPTEQMK